MNWMCKIFGHKYISKIKTHIFGSGTYVDSFKIPRCKRCGKRMDEE